MSVSGFRRINGESSALARTVGLLAVLLVMLLVWLSADPEAHEHFHHDADEADHHCAITEFALGEGYYLAPLIVVPPVPWRFEAVRFEAVEVLREPVDYALLPICGPPLSGLTG